MNGLVWMILADPELGAVPGCLTPGPGVIGAGEQWPRTVKTS